MQTMPKTDLILAGRSLENLELSIDSRLSETVSGMGNTPTLECAGPILAVITQLQFIPLHGQMKRLKKDLIDELFSFEAKAIEAKIPKQNIAQARYMLCAVLDELILNRQFNESSELHAEDDWSRESLIATFYQDNMGGQKFFEIVQYLLSDPHQHIEVLELALICLALGFEGKYRILPQGMERLGLLREQLFTCIERQRGKTVAAFSPKPKHIAASRKTFLCPLAITAAISLFSLSAYFIYLDLTLTHFAAPLYHAITLFSQGN